MRLTKHGHACVRLDEADTAIVLDPGALSDPAVSYDADALLITHEHFDHFVVDTVKAAATANPELVVWAPESVVAQLADVEELSGRVRAAAHGDSLRVGSLDVHVYGEWHAPTHLDPVRNVGYLVEGRVFHPGDAFTVPGEPVATLLLPVHAPWSKLSEVIDYVREVGADQAYAVHDGLLNDTGLAVVGSVLGESGPGTPTPYARLTVGETTEV